MNYRMSNPCPQCPFRNDIEGYLTAERVDEICDAVLRQQSFPCHKTTEAREGEDGESEMCETEDSEQCAGAEIFAMKHGVCSQMRRISGRLGREVAELNEDAPICEDVDEMLEVHSV